MGNTLYLECYFGISGDMTVAALLDLGADAEVLDKVLKSIPVSGFETKISRVKKAGLDVCDFAVILDEAHENHDHDMEYLHGHHPENEHYEHEHHHEHHEYEHHHGYHHEQGHKHIHEHRGLADILKIIEQSEASEKAKATAERIFRILARAEAKAHGVSMEEVHFHEVGAVDSIVDILAAAVCLDNLDIENVIVPELYEGCGTIRCQHGLIPVPVPAVLNIVNEHDIRLHLTNVEGELVTPTGAAIAAAMTTSRNLPEQFRIKKTGLGAGKREYNCPGFLRAMLIEEPENSNEKEMIHEEVMHGDIIYKLETNIDDCGGEELGFAMELLLAAGARDVSYIPIFMKKNRPAYQLNVICTKEQITHMEEIIFKGTTTIGIRRMAMERTILPRENRAVSTRFGEAEVKVCTLPDGEKRCYPEYRSAAAFAKKHDISYKEAYQEIQKCSEEQL